MYVITPVSRLRGIKFCVHSEESAAPISDFDSWASTRGFVGGFWYWRESEAKTKCAELNATLEAGM